MTGNENFTDPEVPMPDFDKGTKRLQTAIINRDNGKLAQIEIKNASANMDAMLRTQSQYVTETSKGDIAIIETSDF